jgi:alkylation response protein AidB-like acyl-CoA dehydrogenase
MQMLQGGRIGVAAQGIGVARAALATAKEYAATRKSFGVPLYNHQTIGGYLAQMVTQLDAARYLVLGAATLHDQGLTYRRQASMAKLYASRIANEIAYKALQIHGGYGYVTDFPVERHFRDARILEIYEGTSEIQQLVITEALMKDT